MVHHPTSTKTVRDLRDNQAEEQEFMNMGA